MTTLPPDDSEGLGIRDSPEEAAVIARKTPIHDPPPPPGLAPSPPSHDLPSPTPLARKRAPHSPIHQQRNQQQTRRNFNRFHSHKRPRRQSNVNVQPPVTLPKCSVCGTAEPKIKYKCPKCRAPYCSLACCQQHKTKGCNAPAASDSTTETLSLAGQPSGAAPYKSKYGGITVDNGAFATPVQPVSIPTDWRQRFDDLDNGWKITSEMTAALHQSPWVRRELQDPALRALLRRVATASNRVVRTRTRRATSDARHPDHHHPITEQEQMLHHLRASNPAFRTFLDKALVVAGVLLRHRHTNGGDSNHLQEQEQEQPLEQWLQSTPYDAGSSLAVVLRPLPPRRRPPPMSTPGDHDHTLTRSSSSSSSSSEEEDSESVSSSSSNSTSGGGGGDSSLGDNSGT